MDGQARERASSFLPRLRGWARSAAVAAVDLLFPAHCAWCAGEVEDHQRQVLLCERCQLVLGPLAWPSCAVCGAAAAPNLPRPQGCRLCRKTRFYFETVVSLGGYKGELGNAIRSTKHARADFLAAALGDLFALRRADELAALRPELVVPVPMHWMRRLGRQTNVPELLARRMAKELRLPVLFQALRQRRRTAPQKTLLPRERFRNVRGAFAARRNWLRSARPFEGKRLVLVDDVMTTGATCSEAARTLMAAGADSVIVAVLARAEGDDRT